MDDFAEFRHFKFLLAVAENRGFRAAAEALHTAQPSLSRQVREFQEHYHLSLFRKIRGKGIVLTPTGEALLVVARTVLEVRDDAIAALAAIQSGEAEVFRVGCSPFVDKTICKAAADTYHKLLPAAEFRSSSSDNHALLHQLSAGRLDAAIVSLPVHDETLRVELLKQKSLVACLPAAHPLAQKAALSGSDLTANLKVFRDPFQHPGFALRLVLADHIGIPRENEPDLLAEAESVFAPKKPKAVKPKDTKARPSVVKAVSKKAATTKKAA